MVDPAKITFIINLEVPMTKKQLHSILGHTSYYRKFFQGYALIMTPMEKFLKKDIYFFWDVECQKSFELLKEKMVSAPILIFPDWAKVFHVHVDASGIALGAVLMQLGEGDIDHRLCSLVENSSTERNYSTTKCEGLEMVYAM